MGQVAEFGELIGVSSSTLRRWETEGKLIPGRTLGNQRIYGEEHLSIAKRLKTGKVPDRAIVYCRVSSSCFSSRLYGLRKYKSKVKKIVEGVDPCED